RAASGVRGVWSGEAVRSAEGVPGRGGGGGLRGAGEGPRDDRGGPESGRAPAPAAVQGPAALGDRRHGRQARGRGRGNPRPVRGAGLRRTASVSERVGSGSTRSLTLAVRQNTCNLSAGPLQIRVEA